jgi:hypothetical protein
VIAGQSLRPGFGTSVGPGWGRVVGVGSRNVDFVLRSEFIAGAWYRDCVASVDVMGWDETMEDGSLGIVLRAQPEKALWHCQRDGLPRNRYAGMLTFKTAGTTPESVLAITGPGGEVLAESRRFPGLDGEKPYRLQFGVVGARLTLELFDLERPETALLTCRANDGRLDGGMDALHGTKAAGDRYDVFIDRFMVTGVTP